MGLENDIKMCKTNQLVAAEILAVDQQFSLYWFGEEKGLERSFFFSVHTALVLVYLHVKRCSRDSFLCLIFYHKSHKSVLWQTAGFVPCVPLTGCYFKSFQPQPAK